jgi:CheY-like chemotaxis protein
MAKRFESFYATTKERHGKGVDLSLVPGVVVLGIGKGHVSATELNSEPGKSIFRLFLPAAQKTAAEARTQPAQEKFRGHGERVLFVDDEESMVFLMERWLERLGYKVTGCTVPEKALEMFRLRSQEFDMVLSDLSMPQMSGVELARELLQIRPGMPILIASGYVNPADNEEIRTLGLPDLLLKPNSIEELGQIIHSIFANCKSSAPEGQTRTDSKPGPMAAAAGT